MFFSSFSFHKTINFSSFIIIHKLFNFKLIFTKFFFFFLKLSNKVVEKSYIVFLNYCHNS